MLKFFNAFLLLLTVHIAGQVALSMHIEYCGKEMDKLFVSSTS